MAGPTSKTKCADRNTVPEHLVAETIDGELVTRRHGFVSPSMARTMLGLVLGQVKRSRSNTDAPWQIVTLPELHLDHDVLVPELAAWSVEGMPILPDDHADFAPDWVCELVSKDAGENPALSRKLEVYRQFGVRCAWILDLSARRLNVLENDGVDWRQIGAWNSDEHVRAKPFDAISISLADLWPLDPPLGLNEDPTPYYAGDR